QAGPSAVVPLLLLSVAVGAGLVWWGAARVFRDPSRREQHRAEQIIRHAPDAILTTNQAGQILSFNLTAEELFGYRAAELLGQRIATLMQEPPRRRRPGESSCTVPVGSVLGVSSGARELLGRRKDGQTFPLEVAVCDCFLDGERVSAVFTRDVSRRKQAQ